MTSLAADHADTIGDIGLFALPGDDAAKNGLTVWASAGVYIPKSTEGAKRDAARQFLAYIASPEGCAAFAQAGPPSGPYMVKGCTLPADTPQAIKDMQPYIDAPGGSSLALEFLSPIKGRRWSRSRSRSGPGSGRPRTAPRSTTRT